MSAAINRVLAGDIAAHAKEWTFEEMRAAIARRLDEHDNRAHAFVLDTKQKLGDARAALRSSRQFIVNFAHSTGQDLIAEIDRALDAPAPVAVPATRLCPCGELACAGVDDDANHQCGGPKEACGAAGCQECAAPDPMQSIQREGSITHADLMAVRERYGALYAAVFPIVPTLLCMFIERSSSPGDRKSAREAFTQLEACK